MAATITPVAKTPAPGRVVQGTIKYPAQVPAPVPQGYGLAYQMGGPYYMYGETPRFGAYYRDGGTPPGQIHGNFAGSREGADMFGFWPTMFQRSPYATASQMYTPGLGVMPLIGYPSRYPHVIMGGYSDYGAGIANQAMGMMLPLLMMGLYRQMFPMPGAAPAVAAKGAGGGGKGGSGGGSAGGGAGADAGIPAGTPAGAPAIDNGRYDFVYPDWAVGRSYDDATGRGGGIGMGTMGPTVPFVTRQDGSIDTERSAPVDLLSQVYNHRDNGFVGPMRGVDPSLVRMGGNGGASMALVDYARTPAPVEETVVRGASDAPIPLQPLR